MRTHRSPLAVLGLLLAGSIAVAGCSPITTTHRDALSDGVRIELGESDAGPDLTGENLIVLAEEEGGSGIMLGALTNRTAEDSVVTITLGAETLATVALSTDGISLGTEGGARITLDEVPAAPGAFVELGFSTPEHGAVQRQVPVLDGTLPEYAEAMELLG